GAPGRGRASTAAAAAMEFDDRASCTIAGVTDWNNAGMHGSDVNVRTSEALAKETLALKNSGLVESSAVDSKAGTTSLNSVESKGQLLGARENAGRMLAKADTADGHRLLGELNERLGDRLHA